MSTVNGANYYTQFQQEVSKLMDLEEVTFSRYSQVIDNWLKSHSEDNEILSYCALVVLYFVDFYYTCNGIQLQYARNNGLNQTLYKDFCVIYPQERNSFLSAYYLLRDQELWV